MRWWEYATLLRYSEVVGNPVRVLDVGGDKSVFPVALKRRGADVYVVDLNLDEHTENWYRREGINCLRYDAVRLPYPDGFFDRVFSTCVLEHIGDTTCRGWSWRDAEEKLLYGWICENTAPYLGGDGPYQIA